MRLLLLSLLICPLLGAAEPVTHVYKKVGGRELKLTIVNPPDWQASDQRPAMVFFHGGGWVGGKPTQFNEHSADRQHRHYPWSSRKKAFVPIERPV